MPPPASSERTAPSDELRAEVAVPRRSPPPHLGDAYRNVFVETAVLEVVITLPVASRGAAGPGAPASAAADRRPGTSAAPLRRSADPLGANDQPPAPVPDAAPSVIRAREPAPLAGGGPERHQVQLSRRALAVLVALAGLGLLALVVLAAVGATLLLGGAVSRP